MTDALGSKVTELASGAGLVGDALAKFGPIGTAAAAGLGLVVESFHAINIAAQAELGQLKIDAVIKATGDASGATAQQLEKLAEELAATTFATRDQVRSASAELLTFTNVTGANFERTIRVAQDMATIFGGDVQSSVVSLGRALEDPTQGLARLARAHVILTEAEKDQIKTLQGQGDLFGAQSALLKDVEERYSGAGAGAHGGLAGAIDEAKKAQEEFDVALGKTLAPTAKVAVDAYAGALRSLTAVLEEDVNKALTDTLAKIKQLQDAQQATQANDVIGNKSGIIFNDPVFAPSRAQAGGGGPSLAALQARALQLTGQITAQALGDDAAAVRAIIVQNENYTQTVGTQKTATDAVVLAIQRKIDASRLDADQTAIQTARDKAFNDVLAANPNIKAAGGVDTLREQAVAAADLAEKQVRQTLATRDAATAAKDEAEQHKLLEAALAAESDRRIGLTQSIDDQIALIQVEGVARDQLRAVMEAQAKAQKDGNLLEQDDIDLIKERVALLDNRKQQEADRAQAEKDRQKQLDQFAANVQHTGDKIVDIGAKAFAKLFDKSSFQDFFAQLVKSAEQAFAQIASEALVRPIIMPILGALVGGAAGGGSGGGGGGIGASIGGAGGGGNNVLGLLGNIGSLGSSIFGNGGISGLFSGAIDSVGSFLGFAPSIASITSAGNIGAFTSEAALGESQAGGILGSTSFGSFLGGAGAGFAAGSLLNGLAGGNSTNGTVGSAVGSIAGAIIGSIIPGIGTLIGGLIGGGAGGLLGGLFGPGTPSPPSASARVQQLGGRFQVFGSASTREDPSAAIANANAAADAINKIVAAVGGTGVAFNKVFQLGNVGGNYQLTDENRPGFAQNFGDPTTLISSAIAYVLKGNKILGASDTVNTVLQNTQATTADQLNKDLGIAALVDSLDKLKSSVTVLQAPTDQAAQAVKQISDAFDQLQLQAAALGIGGNLQADFAAALNSQVAQQIDAIENPLKQSLAVEQAVADARVQLAQKLGADLTQVDRINALQRQQILMQQTGNLQQVYNSLIFGAGSTLSASAQYAGARAAFAAAEAQTASGAPPATIAATVQQFVASSRAVFASGPQYAADFNRALGLLNTASGGALDTGAGALTQALNQNTAQMVRSDADRAALQQQIGDLQAQVLSLQSQITRLMSLAA